MRLRSVGKTFADGTVALDDISLAVDAGEFVSVVGPSGCGKSTLLGIAAGLTRPTTGAVEREAPENLGYVFQDPTLLPWRTVERNIMLPGELHGVPREDRARRTADAIALVGLQGFERHRPHALSGGMRMRVSLARALTMSPRTFLFDEPFGALDEITRERLEDELLALFVRKRFGAIFVTHSVGEAVYLSSRVVVLSARPGRVVAEFTIPFAYPRRGSQRFRSEHNELTAEVAAAVRWGSTGTGD
jgi:NitT/TauT family transport system ATP-binding protein